MQVMTSWFGPIDVDAESVLTFPVGLPGLEHCTRFKLLHDSARDTPVVRWLQSLDDPDVTFSVVDPAVFGVRYELTLSDEEAELLQVDSEDQVAVLMLLGRDLQSGAVTPRAHSPLLINVVKRRGVQKLAMVCELVFKNI